MPQGEYQSRQRSLPSGSGGDAKLVGELPVACTGAAPLGEQLTARAELDDLAELILWVLREFNVAILLIEHRMRLVQRLCDAVTVLNFGRTIFEGMTTALTECDAVVEAYFGEDHAAIID